MFTRLALRGSVALIILGLSTWAHAQVTYGVTQVSPDPHPPEVYQYWANDFNDRGEVVGGAYSTTPFWAWIWQHGEFTRLPALPDATEADYVYANGLNDRTQIVGRSGDRPVAWIRGQIRDLSPTTGEQISVSDLNNIGMMIGGVAINGISNPIVQWRGHRLMLENLPGAQFSQAARINELGVISGNTTLNSARHAVVWRLGRIRDLGVLPGVTARLPAGSTIVGRWLSPSASRRA